MALPHLPAPTLALGFLFSIAIAGAGCMDSGSDDTVRLGYFPNITHAQALYGIETGLFERALAPEYKLQTRHFNAGPSAFEALLTGQLDMTYVGPSPTLNAMAATNGEVVRILSGTASGGARFIVQPDAVLKEDGDFAGKSFASPQLGNTQDVSLKHYLRERGHRTTDQGGSVQVINAANPDILTLFIRDDIDGAWLPEPWATRLELDGHGVELLDERNLWPDGKFVTTHLVTTRTYLEKHPDAVRRVVEAHVEATAAIQAGGAEVLDAINNGIEDATGQRIGDALLEKAFAKVNFTYDPLPDTFYDFADMALDLGLLRAAPPQADVVYRLETLNAVLTERGLPTVAKP
jgi:NitT/TauT family transport system substrate-binding protein